MKLTKGIVTLHCIVAFVVIFCSTHTDPPKETYPASQAHLFYNKACVDSLFVLEGARAYQTSVDSPNVFLCRYPSRYVKSPLLKGTCFFGRKVDHRIYTNLPGSPGEICFEESDLTALDSFYHSPQR